MLRTHQVLFLHECGADAKRDLGIVLHVEDVSWKRSCKGGWCMHSAQSAHPMVSMGFVLLYLFSSRPPGQHTPPINVHRLRRPVVNYTFVPDEADGTVLDTWYPIFFDQLYCVLHKDGESIVIFSPVRDDELFLDT
jgi:hypothetical protein